MPYPVGTCRGCGVLSPHASRCDSCREERRAATAAERAHRREHGLCLVCGQPAARVPGERANRRRHCKRHLKYYAARDRAYRRRISKRQEG